MTLEFSVQIRVFVYKIIVTKYYQWPLAHLRTHTHTRTHNNKKCAHGLRSAHSIHHHHLSE